MKKRSGSYWVDAQARGDGPIGQIQIMSLKMNTESSSIEPEEYMLNAAGEKHIIMLAGLTLTS